MYQMPSEEERPGCREVWVLTRAVFAIILPAMAAIFAVLLAAAVTFVMYARHPALALVPIAAVVGLLYVYARWERRRFRPPDL
jgi:hypothetical protein